MSAKAKSKMNRTDNPREYKMLKKQVDLSCPHCKPHKVENASRKAKYGHRKPRNKK